MVAPVGCPVLPDALPAADGCDPAHGGARADGDDGELTRGGTGFGVRLLVDLLAGFEKLG